VIVDFRVNPPYGGWLDIFFFRPRPTVEDPVRGNALARGRGPMPSFAERSLELFMGEMDAAGIDLAVITGQQSSARYGSVPNDDVARLARAYPTRFVAFAGIDASSPQAVTETRRALETLGARGISMQPGWGDPPLHLEDERIFPIYDLCQRSGVPVMLTSSQYMGPDMTWAMPHHVQAVARAFPDLALVISHACWPWTTQACGMAMMCPNVYLMPDFYLNIPDMPGARDYVDAANTWLGERMLYSSCYPTRPLGQSIEEFYRLPIHAEVRPRLLGDNAMRLLGLVEPRRA
jgi:predicted TIM-barrel fold metal-dependent hydrolase